MRLAEVSTVLRHRVRLVHTVTGAPVPGVAARIRPAPYRWALRTLPDGTVVVTAPLDDPDPTPLPRLAVTVVDGRTADVLAIPPVPGEPPATVVVDLDAAEIDHPVHPVPMTLSVVLTVPATGAPRTGRTVTARARSGPNPRPTVALPEVSPGVYTSAAVEWTARLVPADLLVDGTLLRAFSLDLTHATTRIHLVDTT